MSRSSVSKVCYQFFSVLANPTRLDILELLCEGPKSVTEIAEALKKEQSLISHNLKPLTRCRFVFVERRKKERLYHLNKESVEKIFKIFSYHAEKYCPTEGRCLTDEGLKERKRREASTTLYLNHL